MMMMTMMSEATRQLLHRLAFNLGNLTLFGIEQKPEIGLNFTVEQGCWLQLRTQLEPAPVDLKETSGNESVPCRRRTATQSLRWVSA